eukprot:TRINITY_DN14551_c0_g1_i1.p1 TRINITY_DN14551_c0_g1~~TRINITY_DN14551_c0_g1_i1.p1  ORF type:complete len:68 (-),score=6.61 TRINITY_DN14551_c0_g1_i1:378-581(-)
MDSCHKDLPDQSWEWTDVLLERALAVDQSHKFWLGCDTQSWLLSEHQNPEVILFCGNQSGWVSAQQI